MVIAEQNSSNFQPQFFCMNNCSQSSWKVILGFYLCLILTEDHYLFQLEVPPALSVWFRFPHCPAEEERKKQFHLKIKQRLRGIWWFIFMGEKLVFPLPCASVCLVWRAGLSSVPCPQLRGKIRIKWYFWLRHTRATWSLPDHQHESEQPVHIQFPLVSLERWKARKNPGALHFISFPQHSHSLVQMLPSAWRTEVHMRIKIHFAHLVPAKLLHRK